MDEFLKDYYHYQDLYRLNHQEYFHQSFQIVELSECITSPSNHIEYSQSQRNLTIYFYNFSSTDDKNVYILLKWLLTAHDIIQRIKYPKVMREMQHTLSIITKAKIKTKYESYLFQKLIKPYKHYLQKLCLLLDAQSTNYTKMMIDNKSIQKLQQQWFIKYNFIKYTLTSFTPILVQFIGFFKENYPFLCKVSSKIGKNIQKYLKELKNGFKILQIKIVQKSQIDYMQETFTKMNQLFPSSSSQSLLLTQSEICHKKFKMFFESGSKVEGEILFTS